MRTRFLVALTLLLAAIPAAGAHASFSSVPDDTWVTNGRVDAVATAGNHVYLGGSFSRIGPNTGHGVGLDPSDGSLAPGFDKLNGPVYASIPDGSGGLYVGGSFTQAGSAPRTNVAHLQPSGSVDPGFAANASGGAVYALALSGGRLYLAGEFDHVNGAAKYQIAAVDAATGAVDSGFTADTNGNLGSGARALAVAGGRLFVGGLFTQVNGSSTGSLVALDPATGTPQSSFGAQASGTVNALAVANGKLIVGGNMSLSKDATSRSSLAAASPSDGTVDASFPAAFGTVNALAASGNRVFAGGSFSSIGGNGAIDRLGAVDAAADTVDTGFDPSPNGPVRGLLAKPSGSLYVGGDFGIIASTARNGAAALDPSTGAIVSGFDPNPDASAYTFAVSGSHLFMGGGFDMVGGLARSNLAALNASTGVGDSGFS
ncbi:MAG: trimeric autotransporter adhesin, partial [Solirubrobacteraceae bacterium]|nr:trimeric autotransporter adhesin [Solirubrobacteraceae bacterium]